MTGTQSTAHQWTDKWCLGTDADDQARHRYKNFDTNRSQCRTTLSCNEWNEFKPVQCIDICWMSATIIFYSGRR